VVTNLQCVLQIPNVWGHLNVVARGRGQALIQMDVAWGVDHESLKDAPSEDSFELRVHEYYDDFRNKSKITIQTCFRLAHTFIANFLFKGFDE
jgi:CD109 antigen